MSRMKNYNSSPNRGARGSWHVNYELEPMYPSNGERKSLRNRKFPMELVREIWAKQEKLSKWEKRYMTDVSTKYHSERISRKQLDIIKRIHRQVTIEPAVSISQPSSGSGDPNRTEEGRGR